MSNSLFSPDSPDVLDRAKGKKRKMSEIEDDEQVDLVKKKVKKVISLATPEEKRVRTLDYIISSTKEVAIGPLEYAGHGKTVKGPKGAIRCVFFYECELQLNMSSGNWR